MVKKLFAEFQSLKLCFNRLFIEATKAELKQTVIRSEREKEIYSANFILVHSTLIYIQFPEQPLGSTSNHSQITTYTTTKR